MVCWQKWVGNNNNNNNNNTAAAATNLWHVGLHDNDMTDNNNHNNNVNNDDDSSSYSSSEDGGGDDSMMMMMMMMIRKNVGLKATMTRKVNANQFMCSCFSRLSAIFNSDIQLSV